jgi:hypothetical protein
MIDYRFHAGSGRRSVQDLVLHARDSVAAANRVESAVFDACVFLAQQPWSGSPRKDVTALGVHFWTVQQYPNYVVVYMLHVTQP